MGGKQTEVGPAVDAQRLSRRNAMKVAVGAAAAAAVWSAPKIEGFSLVPDYASAASCAIPNDFRSTTKNATLKSCNQAGVITRKICWGNATCSPGTPTTNTGTAVCGSASVTSIVLPDPSGGNIGLSGSVAGDVYNGTSNTAVQSANSRISSLSLTGMDANVGSCKLDVTGSCSSGPDFRAGIVSTALGNASSETRNANGSFSDVWLKCVGSFNSGQNASFTLTLTCNFNC